MRAESVFPPLSTIRSICILRQFLPRFKTEGGNGSCQASLYLTSSANNLTTCLPLLFAQFLPTPLVQFVLQCGKTFPRTLGKNTQLCRQRHVLKFLLDLSDIKLSGTLQTGLHQIEINHRSSQWWCALFLVEPNALGQHGTPPC